MRFRLLVLTAIVSSTVALHTASSEEPLDWWGNVDGFLDQQNRHILARVARALDEHPPAYPEPPQRQLALLALDGVLHEEAAPKRVSVHEFLHRRIEKAAQDIENRKASDGAIIWKLYNHGFVIRTASVTFGYDLVRAHSGRAEGFAIPDELFLRVVKQCDALFISHRHRDHADRWVAQAFLDRGKPVVAPPEVWKDDAIHDRITHLERSAGAVQQLLVRPPNTTLRVVNFPGHQGANIENNVPLVITPEGLSFIQTGDQSNSDDFQWIDAIGRGHKVDVLFPNCWTPDITRMVAGVRPRLVIPGHENEMGHTVDHREPHWLTYVRLRDVKTPSIVMTWGERYHYTRKQFE